ncbi:MULTISPECIES: class I SAM-dependent methyltransferase [unclassified Leptolyngbya]|uniref:class I SAM-dependent methyltransferase n=1 Tax=unclassified Leptolyngbya TaxID=2650499 RepID=UPI001681E49B|nr:MULTISPECIES: class I SAM-dependent methyltransferase [unclassified Leptolyngbya]MBD1913634.1 methyltransferase domain-containing protein [Leptolyngbya sp. FACHB-8]MBD2154035.1 methyltransferase domain-containing protein [Leptolyngbya sp. FACHB-16]
MTAQMINPTEFDSSKAEAFAEQMLSILNSGALALMVSIGHRTELFDTMAELPPSTSQQIADAAGLNERYVREWLGAMVTGRMVEYDAIAKTYSLPAEHAAFLTRAVASDNVAVFAQYIPLLGGVEEQIIDCFYKGGGVPYSEYKRFHAVMAEDSGQSVVSALFDHVLPLIPGLTEALHRGIDVLDLGCGCGRALNKLAEVFPNSRFTGYDFSGEAIATANAEARMRKLNNIQFQVKDAAALEECDRYDWITTFDAIHDQAKPDVVLQNICKALRPDGVYLMQDIHASTDVAGNLEHPIAPLLYTISCMHCMTVSLAYGGMGLGTMWGTEKALQMLADAGFKHVEIKQLAHDFQNDYYIIRKS